MLKIQVAREKGKFEVEYLKALDCLNKLEAVIKTFRNELFFDDERQNKVDLDFGQEVDLTNWSNLLSICTATSNVIEWQTIT